MFNIIEPSPHHVQMKNRYALKPVRETNLSNIQRAIHNLEKGNYLPVTVTGTLSRTKRICIETRKKYRRVETSFTVYLVMKKVNESVTEEAARSESKVLIKIVRATLDYLRIAYRYEND